MRYVKQYYIPQTEIDLNYNGKVNYNHLNLIEVTIRPLISISIQLLLILDPIDK